MAVAKHHRVGSYIDSLLGAMSSSSNEAGATVHREEAGADYDVTAKGGKTD